MALEQSGAIFFAWEIFARQKRPPTRAGPEGNRDHADTPTDASGHNISHNPGAGERPAGHPRDFPPWFTAEAAFRQPRRKRHRKPPAMGQH